MPPYNIISRDTNVSTTILSNEQWQVSVLATEVNTAAAETNGCCAKVFIERQHNNVKKISKINYRMTLITSKAAGTKSSLATNDI